jgi:flagellar biosynthesis/type III secretory pathway protein FliH
MWQEELRQFRDADSLPELIHRLECHNAPEVVVLFAREAAGIVLKLTDRVERAEDPRALETDEPREEGYEDGWAKGYEAARKRAVNAILDMHMPSPQS